MTHLKHFADIIIKKFPQIVMYTVFFYFLIVVGDRLFYKFAPASYFISNIQMTVQNSVEHSDVPYRICRERRGDFIANGVRTIHIIPEGKGEDDKVYAGKYPLLNFAIDGDKCENLFIRKKQFDHTPGRYVITTTYSFRVRHGEEKHISFTSNVYVILKTSSLDIQNRIEQLQKQINELRRLQKQMGAANPGKSSASPTTTKSNTATPSTTAQGSTAKPSQNNNSGGSSDPPSTEEPSENDDGPVVEVLEGLLNGGEDISL